MGSVYSASTERTYSPTPEAAALDEPADRFRAQRTKDTGRVVPRIQSATVKLRCQLGPILRQQ
jgi:hypothetical protein